MYGGHTYFIASGDRLKHDRGILAFMKIQAEKPPGSSNFYGCTEAFYFESEHDRLDLSALEGCGGSFGDKCELGCH